LNAVFHKHYILNPKDYANAYILIYLAPELSTLVKPGIYLNISVVLLGLENVNSLGDSVLIAKLDSILDRGMNEPVTTTSPILKTSMERMKLAVAVSPGLTVFQGLYSL
jgi:hypothetical protein